MWQAARREGGAEAVQTRCENCKMAIDHEPYRKGERTFCCDGCAYGGPCVC